MACPAMTLHGHHKKRLKNKKEIKEYKQKIEKR
jgi:hypothetical protein